MPKRTAKAQLLLALACLCGSGCKHSIVWLSNRALDPAKPGEIVPAGAGDAVPGEAHGLDATDGTGSSASNTARAAAGSAADGGVPASTTLDAGAPALTAGSDAKTGAAGGSSDSTAGKGGEASAGQGGSSAQDAGTPAGACSQSLPSVGDYAANGPYITTARTADGPDGRYTIVRPMMLGKDGFKHPIAIWGNDITTTPTLFSGLLQAIASHGFVLIASEDSQVTAQQVIDGLDWLAAQNERVGSDFFEKLDVQCAVALGCGVGAAAVVTAASRPNVVATVALHSAAGSASMLQGPLLLLTSKNDTFITAPGFVDPTFESSRVTTFYATLTGATDNGHTSAYADGGAERAPAIAWLRLWAFRDREARKYFDGDKCILCQEPWTNPRRKLWR